MLLITAVYMTDFPSTLVYSSKQRFVYLKDIKTNELGQAGCQIDKTCKLAASTVDFVVEFSKR
jgi:hypothetical protein